MRITDRKAVELFDKTCLSPGMTSKIVNIV